MKKSILLQMLRPFAVTATLATSAFSLPVGESGLPQSQPRSAPAGVMTPSSTPSPTFAPKQTTLFLALYDPEVIQLEPARVTVPPVKTSSCKAPLHPSIHRCSG